MFAVNQRNFWRYWLGGIILFAILVVVSAQLKIAAVPGGLFAHQSAGSATVVNEIQEAWLRAGLIDIAKLVMAIDFLFVAVYGFGALIGGLLFLRQGPPKLRKLGGLIAFAAIVFFLSDNGENIAQSVQLFHMRGDDSLAKIAASLGPVKQVAILVTFFGLLAALFLQRWASR